MIIWRRYDKEKIKIFLNVFFKIINFIFILYMLSCFLISFRSGPLKIIASCVNISTIAFFKKNMDRDLTKKYRLLILVISQAILGGLVYKFEIFTVSSDPRK